jgi:hypothetical protein
MAVLLLAFGAAAAVSSGLSGLFEPLFATAAAAVAAFAVGILRRSRDIGGGPEPGHTLTAPPQPPSSAVTQ